MVPEKMSAARQGLRHELKFLVSARSVLLLRQRLSRVMEPDPHAGPEGRYFIRSLYFDDMDYTAYREKLNGVDTRAKYRLRYYNYNDSYIAYEKKEKFRDMTRKAMAAVSRPTAEAMAARGEAEGEDPLLTEFQALWRRGLRPRVLVDYDRYVFVHPVGNTRVTLDLDVRTSPWKTDLFCRDLAMLPVLDPGLAVLEVKYDDQFPRHVARLLEGVPRDRAAVSKYCRCLALLE